MEFFHGRTSWDFMGKARMAATFSLILTLGSLGSLAVQRLNFGIDFTGGVLLEVGYAEAADLTAIRNEVVAGGHPDAQVQNFGSSRDVLIRLMPTPGQENSKLGQQILDLLKQSHPDTMLRRVEYVGPQVGKDLVDRGGSAVVVALILIALYVWFRFQWKFAVGAFVATLHDAIIVVGVFSVFRIPFDLSVLGAVLAIIGYSLNDTIVIFDRIRENFRKARRGTPTEIMNVSINETLSRSIITHGVTALVVVALLLFGGETLRGFAIAMMVGIVFGAYSSIFIASAIALWLNVSPAELMPPKETAREVDSTP
jgi:preprotein translocase subunit SecF